MTDEFIEKMYEAFANWYHDDGGYDNFLKSETMKSIQSYCDQQTAEKDTQLKTLHQQFLSLQGTMVEDENKFHKTIIEKTLADLTNAEVQGILNTAMDDDEWHTPSASDINIKEQTSSCIYGWFNCSKHNQYHDQDRWFNINNNNVQIWIKEFVKGKADKNYFKPI